MTVSDLMSLYSQSPLVSLAMYGAEPWKSAIIPHRPLAPAVPRASLRVPGTGSGERVLDENVTPLFALATLVHIAAVGGPVLAAMTSRARAYAVTLSWPKMESPLGPANEPDELRGPSARPEATRVIDNDKHHATGKTTVISVAVAAVTATGLRNIRG